MFGLMGNCISCVKKRRETKRLVTFAILGLDNAGKTTTTKGFSGGPIDPDMAPTVGYSFEKFSFEKFDITLFDLGGGKKIRGIWKNYLHEIYGLIYVVDSTASSRMEETQETLKEILQNPHVSGKPILLLANKQDKENAMDEVDICEQLNIEYIVNANKCPCRIETCSAIRGAGRKMDKNIKNGMRWLMSVVEREFDVLKNRIEQDIEADKALKLIERQERRKRVEKEKAERTAREEAERKRLGIEEKVSDEEMNGDPFKKLDVNEVKKREAKLKEEKRKKKELLQNFENEEKEDEPSKIDMFKMPRSARSLGGLPASSLASQSPRTDLNFASTRSANPLLPPLQTPLGTKFVDEPVKRRKKKKNKSLQDDKDQGAVPLNDFAGLNSLNSKIEDNEKAIETSLAQISRNSSHLSDRIESKGHDDDSYSEDNQPKKLIKRKKKKKPTYYELTESENELEKENAPRPRKLQVLPHPQIQVVPPSLSETFEDTVTPPSSHRRKKKNRFLKKRVGMSDEDSTPRHIANQNFTQQDESHIDDNKTESQGQTMQTSIYSSTNWGLIEELPQVMDESRRFKPNFEEDTIT